MTPDTAIAVLSETRAHRERVTGRAAGILWMVWGAAITIFVLADTALIMGEHAGVSPSPAWSFVFLGLFVVAGAGISNAVWRAHALERDDPTRPWIAWVLVIGIVALTIAFNAAVEAWIFNPLDWTTPTRITPVLYLVMGGAIALTVVFRKRVSIWPGVLATVDTLVFHDILVFIDIPRTVANELAWSLGLGLFVLVTFGVVGLWHYLRG